jgi:glyceraldehyde 3-phosphate dehydrogenase
MGTQRTLGINGLGRIGKLVLWYFLARDDFDRFIVNVGRPVGTSLDSVVQYIGKDTTYGPLHRFLHGQAGVRDIQVVDEKRGLIRACGKEIVVLREARNPKDIPWRDHGVSLVVDCTGTFRDPHAEPDAAKGSLRGHLAAGAPANHKLVSAASCTTTALAHMMRPLLERDLTRHMITAGMSTVHAATSSQPVLDAVPKAGATDLRKTRGAMGNIVLTSTNAAATLEQVMPEIARIGFMADSVRILIGTVSLIILNVTFQSEALPDGTISVERDTINDIYREAAEGEAQGLLEFSCEQNVSADMVGHDAAVIIEGIETHTRTGFMDFVIPCQGPDAKGQKESVRVPLTHVKIFGWYDNEMGSYTNRLGELVTRMAKSM